DVVARAIDREMKLSGNKHVLLDLSPIGAGRIRQRFPNITAECLKRGYDITAEPIPVVPSAHYMCGGVVTDIDSQTSIEALLAAGETTCTGVHGANRLASNSLLEALVFANRAVARAILLIDRYAHEKIDPASYQFGKVTTARYDGVFFSHSSEVLRTTMWDYVGIMRSNDRLAEALKWINYLDRQINRFYSESALSAELVELRNMATTAALIVKCAQKRKESRGLHQNTDYPTRNDRVFLKDTILEKKP
ncbi:MAG: FAD-binding protein, partial [Gemmatimonadota bacterium]|nr:FAD-binding protein [Gemmatimonadota bacterium]